MGIFSTILGGEVAKPIEAVGNVLDKLFTSDDERLDKQALLARLAQAPYAAQVEINKLEAGHRSLFVAGWRPWIGWVCGMGLAFIFLVTPVIQWITGQPGPVLPTAIIMELVLALLGLGALRTVEKLGGKAK